MAAVTDRLHRHREEALARDTAVTMTGMYNVVEKLRSGEDLTEAERRIHETAACGVLRDLHDELDAAVASCYGWEWPLAEGVILERIVALHDERRAEEEAGVVRWIRPEYQVPRFGRGEATEQTAALLEDEHVPVAGGERLAWPGDAIEQIRGIKAAVQQAPGDVEEIAGRFIGARRAIVERHLETLRILAEVSQTPDGRYHAAREMVGA